MARIEITTNRLVIRMSLRDRLLALRGDVVVPLARVRDASPRPIEAFARFHGHLFTGTNLPGIVIAGTFLADSGWTFYDVHDPNRTIRIDVDHYFYRRLIVQVDGETPDQAVARIRTAMGSSPDHVP